MPENHGVHGAFAFPLRIGDAFLGVLTAYRARAGEPSAEQYADGLILASLATAELVSQEAGVGAESGSGSSSRASMTNLLPREVAAGDMVAESLNISIVAALVRIRARAFADDHPVSKTALQIVERNLSYRSSTARKVVTMAEVLLEVPDAAELAVTLIEITRSVTQGAETIEIFTELAEKCVGLLPVSAAGILLRDVSGTLQVIELSPQPTRLTRSRCKTRRARA